ncbi:CapA family protein [Rhodococcus jostii]|uniref:Poly-gamma-glutamate synthesis protein (Capsule biosynthesis protein) n=1 Tax=Rhodococcus jostii TaxID=132919 RepID=A0A1H5DKZ8_RHOJO|nr:CapA family protein [Rhodococcus jostii]SED79440.1 poly-gamma-glutamate synthesis protein (capsule biosynthesis protein) [Rhodococcus jostii]
MSETCTVVAVGDLVLDEPDPEYYFAPSTHIFRSADVAVGHIEVPHSTSTVQASTDVPAPPADPKALEAVSDAGFDVVTLAGNHFYDVGTEGVLDTIEYSRRAGLKTAGGGANLAEAREPAVLEGGGLRVGVLSYNCVGPRESWAASQKAGAAYVKVLTHYELDSATPGGPPSIYTFATPDSLARMKSDIAALRDQVDVVAVALHKGIGHTPALLADYESPVSYAAIDAGADMIIGHHAHIMRGIEIYRGRPIFHGLGNFVTVTHALSPTGGDSAERREWADRRQKMFGFSPDPAMPSYPFHPESRNTAIATCSFDRGGLVRAGFVPCWIDDDARPVPLTADDRRAEGVVDYIEKISRTAGFATEFRRDGDVVVVTAPAAQQRIR